MKRNNEARVSRERSNDELCKVFHGLLTITPNKKPRSGDRGLNGIRSKEKARALLLAVAALGLLGAAGGHLLQSGVLGILFLVGLGRLDGGLDDRVLGDDVERHFD